MDTCPACGAGAIAWVAEAAAEICTRCSAVLADGPAVIDALESYAELDAREPRVPDNLYRIGRASLRQHGRGRVDDLIDAAARRLGVQVGRAQVLYMQLHELSGSARAELLAAAALYASQRLDGKAVDLAAVALACDVPLAAAAQQVTAVRRLRVLSVSAVDPAVYVDAQLACLAALEHAPKANYAAAARLARGVARIVTSFEIPYTMDPLAFAYAIVMHAVQGAAHKPTAASSLIEFAPTVLRARPPHGCIAAPLFGTPSKSTVLARYAELSKMLAHATEALPWFAMRPALKRERDRMRHKGAAQRTASHHDIARYLGDVVDAFDARGPQTVRYWSQFQGVRSKPAAATPRAPLAARLRLDSAAIDAMSDDAVDTLFSDGELASYMRTSDETEFMRTVKGWDASADAARVEHAAVEPQARAPRLSVDPAKQPLFQPIDKDARREFTEEWD